MANQTQKSDSFAPMIIPVAIFGILAFMAVRKSRQARGLRGFSGTSQEHRRAAYQWVKDAETILNSDISNYEKSWRVKNAIARAKENINWARAELQMSDASLIERILDIKSKLPWV